MRWLPFLLISAMAATAQARGYRIDQVPGGYRFECYMCHVRATWNLTSFGRDVLNHLLHEEDYPDPEALPENLYIGEEGNVDWAIVALLDSDGDGYTNGEELGDPMGLFVQHDPQPDFPFTRPDRPEDFPCGSGAVEGPEECDGDAFAGATCGDFDLPGGHLACTAECRIDPSGCTPCGDGVLDPGEACDGAPPADLTCADLDPAWIGPLGCTDDCQLDDSR
ncbi:MAG: hypothetical protein KC620_18500, partial [Myxococcales bacterium]|nr:hypothetical protein [Myxococcales bacterium]